MRYDIKAIPTTYAGVRFRSRLEARWAAFFDLCGIKWEYEPFDLDGWAPDFLLRDLISAPVALVEVKPIDINLEGHYEAIQRDCQKAFRHAKDNVVIVCGMAPDFEYNFDMLCTIEGETKYIGVCGSRIGVVLERHQLDEQGGWHSVIFFNYGDVQDNWREAGNRVQWNAK